MRWRLNLARHARNCPACAAGAALARRRPGHLHLSAFPVAETWMAGTRPAVTVGTAAWCHERSCPLTDPCLPRNVGPSNTSPILTLIRRCGGRVFSVKKGPENASATKHQWFCRTLLAFSKGLAMLIRGVRIGACDGAVSAPAIVAAPLLPTRGAHGAALGPLGPILSLGLLLLSCP